MKKFILTAALSMSLLGTAYAVPCNSCQQGEQTCDKQNCAPTECIAPQTAIDVDPTPSEEVNYVEESPVAQRMTQAEKAKNAKENDSWGIAITIIAMCIVISALAILSILFLCFGKISEYIISRNKQKSKSTSMMAATADHDGGAHVDSGDVIAAIATALSEHFGDGHDMEDTILTIRRMKRAYSPWNSKIYNLRQTPELKRGFHDSSAL